MEPDIAEERADQLRDPLLLQPEELRCGTDQQHQRRRNARKVETLEVQAGDAANPSDSDWRVTIGPQELRFLWIPFQCLWSALLMAVLGYKIPFDERTYACYAGLILVPSVTVFCLLACSRRNQNDRFTLQCRDGIPTLFWMLPPLVDPPDSMQFIFGVAVFVFTLLSFDGIIKCLLYNIICYKKLEDEFFEQEQQRGTRETGSPTGETIPSGGALSNKKPSRMGVCGVCHTWNLGFAVSFFGCPVLSEAPETVT